MLDSLTRREHEILVLISQGLTNQDIAQALILSLGTVKTHTHNIYHKLGVSSRTQALLKAEELGLLATVGTVTQDAATERHNLTNSHISTQIMRLIGRKTELARLTSMLKDDRIRLITILATGGMGKTHLAMALAKQQEGAYRHGVYFCSLARISDVKNLSTTIINDMGLRFQSSEQPEQQLLTYLQDKHLLLVLDNFEHLLDAVPFLNELLQSSPGIRLIVTSRERLNLSTELVFVLGGLDYDIGTDLTAPLQSDAVQLLIERARLINPDFAPQAHEWVQMGRICKLTQGMPLALILAAGWLEMLTLEEIADELAHSIDILQSQLRDLPARQRSMRAAIASSWNWLSDEEKSIFASLSVFRGGFTRRAAQNVTGASLHDLQTLVNRSFIVFTEGRYQMHELLRQFGEEELNQNLEKFLHIHDLHCNYFMNFLHKHLPDMYNDNKRQFVSEMMSDLDNVRAAWLWAIEYVKIDMMHLATETMAAFWHTQGHYKEGIEIFGSALQALKGAAVSEQRDLVIAIMSSEVGWYHIRLGRLDEAEAYFSQGYTKFERLGFPFLIGITDPLVGLAFIASIRGNYEEATHIADQALQQNKANQYLLNQAYAFYALIGINLAQGNYEQALDFGQRAIVTARSAGAEDQRLIAYCFIELGNVSLAMGDYETARSYYLESYKIESDFPDSSGMAIVSTQLGQLALRQADFVEAEHLYQQSLHMYRDQQDTGGVATAQHGLGRVALGRKNYATCRTYLHRALDIVTKIEYAPLLFEILLTFSELKLQLGQVEAWLSLLSFIHQHPSASQETKDQALQILMHYEGVDHTSIINNQSVTTSQSDLAEIVAAVQADLSSPS